MTLSITLIGGPTALIEIRWVTPNVLSANTLARTGRFVGLKRWPLPCRAMNATSRPPSLPITTGSLGLP